MLEKDEGVVLKTARSGETSLLVTFMSRRRGKIRLMAKGFLSQKHPSRGLLETGNHVEVVYYYKENRSLYYIKEASPLAPTFSARDSLPHLAVYLAAMELLDQVCYPGSADEAIVELAVEYGGIVADAKDPLFLFLAFELRLLAVLGAFPDLTGCAICQRGTDGGTYSARDGASYCREHGQEAAPAAPGSLALSAEALALAHRCAGERLKVLAGEGVTKQTRKDLGKIVHWTYTYHVQGYNLPKSLSLI